VPARSSSICSLILPVWIVYSQPVFHFFSNVVITLKPFTTDGIFEGSRGGTLREQDLGCMVVGAEEQSIWVLRLLPVFSYLFVVMHICWGGFWQHFCEAQCLPTHSSQKAVNSDRDFSSWRSNLKLLLISWMIPFYQLSFVYDSRWQICVSSPVTIHDNKLFPSAS